MRVAEQQHGLPRGCRVSSLEMLKSCWAPALGIPGVGLMEPEVPASLKLFCSPRKSRNIQGNTHSRSGET